MQTKQNSKTSLFYEKCHILEHKPPIDGSDTRHLASYVESGSVYLYCISCISNKADGVLVIKLCSWPKGLKKRKFENGPCHIHVINTTTLPIHLHLPIMCWIPLEHTRIEILLLQNLNYPKPTDE